MKKRAKKMDAISTFLGFESVIEGTLEFQGTIRIDGRVTGRIVSEEGTLIIGEKAVINAEISVGVAIVMGEVNGIIEAADRIEVFPPGKIMGDIQAPAVSMDAGVVFNGNCSMQARTLAMKNGKIVKEKLSVVKES
jgi:cytoskeletal protein CcmA (bactofilin family)